VKGQGRKGEGGEGRKADIPKVEQAQRRHPGGQPPGRATARPGTLPPFFFSTRVGVAKKFFPQNFWDFFFGKTGRPEGSTRNFL
jgi:hypothetical protein